MKLVMVIIAALLLSSCSYHTVVIVDIDRSNFDTGITDNSYQCLTDSECQEMYGGDGGPGN